MNETDKKPPVLGLLWLHEIPFLALLAWAFYKTGAEFRGSPWPVIYFGAAVAAAVAILALRCPDEWRVLPNRILFFALAIAWVALFTFLGNSTFGYLDSTSIFWWAFDIYTSPNADGEYGLFIPFAVLALFWWKRKELVARPLGLWSPGILWVAAALFMHLVGYVVQQPRLSYIAFFVGLYGLTGLAWGKNWLKASFFPFFLLALCVPLTGTDWLTFRMRLIVSWIVEHLAHLGFAPDLVRDGTVLMDADHTFAYEVVAACSGIRSLSALLALTTVYGFLTLKTPWKRGVMVLAAFPLAILGNVARLSFTVMVAELWGQNAGKAVETDAGYITFIVAITCTYFLSRWLEKSEPAAPEPALDHSATIRPPEAGHTGMRSAPVFGGLVLAMMALTAGLVLHMKAHQRLGEPGVKTQPVANSRRLEILMPATLPGYASEILTNAETTLQILPADTSYRVRMYQDENKLWTEMTTVLMGSDRSSIHSPYICLLAQGWTIDSDHVTIEPIHLESPSAYDLPVNKLLATKQFSDAAGNQQTMRGIYLYWYVDADHFTPNSQLWMAWWMPRDLLLHGLLERWSYISVFAACPPGQEDATYERMKKLIALALPEFQLVPKGGR